MSNVEGLFEQKKRQDLLTLCSSCGQARRLLLRFCGSTINSFYGVCGVSCDGDALFSLPRLFCWPGMRNLP